MSVIEERHIYIYINKRERVGSEPFVSFGTWKSKLGYGKVPLLPRLGHTFIFSKL